MLMIMRLPFDIGDGNEMTDGRSMFCCSEGDPFFSPFWVVPVEKCLRLTSFLGPYNSTLKI